MLSMIRGSLQIQLQAGLAVGDGRQYRVGQVVAHLRKGQRQDREVDTRTTQTDETDQQRENPGHDDRKTTAGSTFMVSSLNDQTAVYEPTPRKAA